MQNVIIWYEYGQILQTYCMKNSNRIIIFVALALGLVSVAHGQNMMTLKECMQYAIDNSAKIKLQQMSVDDARVTRRDAILRVFTPEISAGTYAYSNFGRSVDPETNTYVSTTSFNNGYQISGSIILFNGFSAVNNMKVSKTALKMGIDKEELTKDEICLATMEAYCNVVYFEQLALILASEVKTAKDVLTLAKKQEELGQKGYADVIEMEAELADREYQLISAKNKYADALLTLKDLMFWPMDKELKIDTSMADADMADSLLLEDETENIINYAVHNLPSISIAKGRMDNAKLELKSAKWRFIPSLSLSAGWSTSYYTYPDMEGYVATPFCTQFRNNGGEYIQLSLSFPIFGRLSTYSNIRKKRNESKRATVEYEQKVREVEAEVIRAVQDRDGASAAFYQADKRAALQEEAYHLNVKKLEQGLISVIDFQKASDNWLSAKTSRLDALLKFYIKRSVVNYYNGISYINQ